MNPWFCNMVGISGPSKNVNYNALGVVLSMWKDVVCSGSCKCCSSSRLTVPHSRGGFLPPQRRWAIQKSNSFSPGPSSSTKVHQTTCDSSTELSTLPWCNHCPHTAQVVVVIVLETKAEKALGKLLVVKVKPFSDRTLGDKYDLHCTSQESTWFEKVCHRVTFQHRLLSACVVLSLITQRCLDRSVQCYFSTHYSTLQLKPSNQRWFYCLLDKQVSVYSEGRLFSKAAISLFTASGTKMKCFFSARGKEQSQYFPWGQSAAPGGCFTLGLRVCVCACMHAYVPTHREHILLLAFHYTW